MTEKNKQQKGEAKKNKFEEKQPLRHPLAVVAQDGQSLKINDQLYSIIVNERDALDLNVLRQKYDPYLDQYDYLVGDVSSEHLRLKGFYKDAARSAIDKKEMTIVDYLTEYCNPGGPYFILELMHPVHYYPHQKQHKYRERDKNRKSDHFYPRNRRKGYRKNENAPFKKRRVHQTKFKKKQSVAVKKEFGRHHSFIIKKKRKGN